MAGGGQDEGWGMNRAGAGQNAEQGRSERRTALGAWQEQGRVEAGQAQNRSKAPAGAMREQE